MSKAFMQTTSGIKFDYLEPTTDMIKIEDIAQSLSYLCRYKGHCRQFYSVAHHSILVCDNVPDHLKAAAMLHDAAEAYLGDMPRHLKRYTKTGIHFSAMELNLMGVIAEKFDVDFEDFNHPILKNIDTCILLDERKHLFYHQDIDWELGGAKPLNIMIGFFGAGKSRQLFLQYCERYIPSLKGLSQ